MSTQEETTRFRLDHEYDRDRVSNGHSRYGVYLNDRSATTFEEIASDYDDRDAAVPFACAAWRIACGPVMVPPFVVFPKRILSARLERNDWDGGAILNVELRTDRPQALCDARTSDGRWYYGWPTSYSGDYEGIGGRELADGRAYLLTTAQVLLRVPKGTLPSVTAVRTHGEALYVQAVECLDAVVRVLNREIGPLLDQLEDQR